LFCDLYRPGNPSKCQIKLSSQLEKAMMKVRKESHNLVATFQLEKTRD